MYRGNSERAHETHTSEAHQRDYETGTSEDHQRVGENGTFESMWGRDCRILAADTSEEQRLYQAKILKINVVMRLLRWNYFKNWDMQSSIPQTAMST